MTKAAQSAWERMQGKIDNLHDADNSGVPRDRISLTLSLNIRDALIMMIRSAGYMRETAFNMTTQKMVGDWADANPTIFRTLLKEKFQEVDTLTVFDAVKGVLVKRLTSISLTTSNEVTDCVAEIQEIE